MRWNRAVNSSKRTRCRCRIWTYSFCRMTQLVKSVTRTCNPSAAYNEIVSLQGFLSMQGLPGRDRFVETSESRLDLPTAFAQLRMAPMVVEGAFGGPKAL